MSWIPIKDHPKHDADVLLLGTHGQAVGCWDHNQFVPSGVEASYDMSGVIFTIGTITHYQSLPSKHE